MRFINQLLPLFWALSLSVPSTAIAQSPDTPTSSAAEKLINEYRFDEASELLEKEIKLARRKKQNTTTLEELLERSRKGSDMLFGTEKVIFVDSTVIDRANFLSAYRLSRETGQIGPLGQLLPGFAGQNQSNGTLCYINELGDKAYLTLPDSAGATKLQVANRWGNAWSAPEPVQGISEYDNNEGYPFVMADGVTLYYAAQGPESLGGYDIFATRYNSDDDSFVRPENIGMPFNSPANDYLYVIDEATGLGWFASDRNQPADKVCVYSFIPNPSREVYDITALGEDYVRAAARITSIAATQANRDFVAAARKRLTDVLANEQKRQDGQACFVINDATVYTQLAQFKHPAARKLAERWLKAQTQLGRMQQQLDAMRRQYGTQPNAALKREILQAEADVDALSKTVGSLAKDMRKAELQQDTRH